MIKKIILSFTFFSIIFFLNFNFLYSAEKKVSIVSFKINLGEQKCQLAIWVTDSKGSFVDTVYVTKAIAQNGLGNRPGGLDDKIGGARISALPVWAHARGINSGNGNFYPSKDKPLPDSITSATPKEGEFKWEWHPTKPLKPGKYFYYIEVSKSFNKNDVHNYSWYRGQPSVIWKGSFTAGNTVSEGKAQIIGHGHPAGADGKIYTDNSTLSTALKYIQSAEAKFN